MSESTEDLQMRNTGMIYALGELLIDMIPTETGKLISEPGSVLKTVSGSAGIFACAAGLLGGKSGFIGKIGRDSLSQLAVKVMREQGVDLKNLTVSDSGQIGIAFLEYAPDGRHYQYYRNRSVGSLLSAEDLDEEKLSGAFCVHYPGMLLELTEEMRGACGRLVSIAHKKGIPVSFDPNIRVEMIARREAMDRIRCAVAGADMIAPTLAEAKMITGRERIPEVLEELHRMGPSTVAITMDENGALISREGLVAVAEGIQVEAVDPTGAGDTFAAAMCVGLRENMPAEKLAAFCNAAGALAVKRRGAIGLALPTRAETEALMASGACRVRVMPKERFDAEEV